MLVSQAAFGIFVIHHNPIIDVRFIYSKSNGFVSLPPLQMTLKTFELVCLVFIASLLLSIPLTIATNHLSKSIVNECEKLIKKRKNSL